MLYCNSLYLLHIEILKGSSNILSQTSFKFIQVQTTYVRIKLCHKVFVLSVVQRKTFPADCFWWKCPHEPAFRRTLFVGIYRNHYLKGDVETSGCFKASVIKKIIYSFYACSLPTCKVRSYTLQ